jgi:hypothetical protein
MYITDWNKWMKTHHVKLKPVKEKKDEPGTGDRSGTAGRD